MLAMGRSRDEADTRAREILGELGLAYVADAPFAQLSGGEAQRLMLGRALAAAVGESLGVRVGQSVSFPGLVPGLVAGLFPWDETDGRRGGLGYSVLIPVDADAPFDECWADVWPVSPSTRDLLLLTAMPAAGQEPPTLGQLNTTLGTGFDGAVSFSQRPTR